MKRILILCLFLLVGSFFIISGCKKDEKTVPSKEETSHKAPTEPAPVPEGTPEY